MIKRSVITAVVLFLAYHFLLPHLSRDYFWVPGQQRANYLRAQKYIHDLPVDLNVVVGSSMANELSQEILGEGFAKLTFPAGGSFTGMEIITATGKKPPLLLIESNTLLRGADDAMLGDVLSSWRRTLRDTSPVFKEEGRPSNYQVGFLNAWAKRIGNGIAKVFNGGKKPEPRMEKPVDPSVMENVMTANRAHLGKPPKNSDLAGKAARLGEMVDALEKSGTRCVFFEMPIDSTLGDLAEPSAVRIAMEKRFPKDQYHWIPLDRSRAYKTSDGIHLVKAEADAMTEHLKREAERIK